MAIVKKNPAIKRLNIPFSIYFSRYRKYKKQKTKLKISDLIISNKNINDGEKININVRISIIKLSFEK
jgi:hypothetical protein